MTKAVEKNNSTIINQVDINNIRHCLHVTRSKISEVEVFITICNVHPKYSNVTLEKYRQVLFDSLDDVIEELKIARIWLEQARQKINRNI